MFKKIADKIDSMLTIKQSDNSFLFVIKSLINRFDTHNITQTAGQLAYFFFLSIFPFIIFVNAIIQKLDLSGNVVSDILSEILPVQIADLIGDYIEYINSLGIGVGAISLGIIVVIFAASKSIRSLSIGINLAYGITEKRYFIKRIILSVILTGVLGILVIMCLIVVTVGKEWIYKIMILVDLPISWLGIINIGKWCATFVIMLVIITFIYYVIPLKKVKLKSVIPGAVCTVIATFAMTYGYSIYIAYFSNFSVLYGSIGVILLLLLWLYFMGLFIIAGAEYNSILEEKKYFLALKKQSK